MSVITIVGAGMMGSALSVPACDNGHTVRLVGTHLDREIIDAVRNTHWHPTMRRALPEPVEAFQLEELDRALELLLERLEEAGVADNTVIALTADHYPYGLTPEEQSELAGHTLEENFELYRNACILYKKGMTPERVERPCSSLDLLPTLCNLFGLDFDSRLNMGQDVFSQAEPLVLFSNRSWLTDRASYNSQTGEVKSLTGGEISEDYAQSIKDMVNNKFTISAWILDRDYWRVLFHPES